MRKSQYLLRAAALAGALLTAGAASASDCLQLDLNAPTPLCIGQTGSIDAIVNNSCTTQLRATVQFALDGRQLEPTRNIRIDGESTLTRGLTFSVPSSAATGSHTLTVTLTESAYGGTTSSTTGVSVESCPAK
jgi:hypothetical protein